MLPRLRFLSRYQFASICDAIPNPSGCLATGVGEDCNAAMPAFLNSALASPPRHQGERRSIRTDARPIVRARTCSLISVR